MDDFETLLAGSKTAVERWVKARMSNPADAEDIQKVLRYRVSAFLKQKPTLTLSKAVALLNENQQVFDDYYTDASRFIDLHGVSTDSYKSMQKELKAFVSSSLGLTLAS